MTTQHDNAKRWQFGLRSLMTVVVLLPIAVAVLCGVFGEQAQFTGLMILFDLVLMLVSVIALALMGLCCYGIFRVIENFFNQILR